MQMKDIRPFARFVRYLRIREDSVFYRHIPLDCRLFYAVEGAGSIEIGGVDIKDLSLEEYNRKVAYVSQDNYLFDDTIRENNGTSEEGRFAGLCHG